ncbi:type I restriction endonuclease, partial [Hydrogenivirga sp. 128-5-R1-1]|uniref:type I restriction endonuclease n=1 Tax=Hydrogenivirga sp. 128-5-R1-1 TaxID=392423 RepID=UPI00015F0A26
MDISEKSFEDIIFEDFINLNKYEKGNSEDFEPEFAIDTQKLTKFIKQTQPKIYEYFELDNKESPKRKKLLDRIQSQINQKGIKEVLINGVKEGAYHIELYYPLPSEQNQTAKEKYQKNIFSIIRQLKYSDKNNNSLDLVIFINGLPVITFELKNRWTKQNVKDAIKQYKEDRNPREEIFKFGKCIVHFAVDDNEVYMTTHLQGKNTIFFPFNKGYKNGAGNPPNPNGIKTEYLWKEILTKESLSNIIENYVNIFERKDPKTGKKKKIQIFPRYHQLDAVRKLKK